MTNKSIKDTLEGLSGGENFTFWQIINVTESTITSYPSVINGQEFSYPFLSDYYENKYFDEYSIDVEVSAITFEIDGENEDEIANEFSSDELISGKF